MPLGPYRNSNKQALLQNDYQVGIGEYDGLLLNDTSSQPIGNS